GGQRTARARRALLQNDPNLTGRDPHFLCSCLPNQAGRPTRSLYDHLVSSHHGRDLPSLLCRILWHATFRNDWSGRCIGAGAVSILAEWWWRRRVDGVERTKHVSTARLLHLPPLGHAGAWAESGRTVRAAGATGRWTNSHSGRKLYPRVHFESRSKGRERIQAHHAGISGDGK